MTADRIRITHDRNGETGYFDGEKIATHERETGSWEQWYVMLLHNGELPGAITNHPNSAYTRSLIADAKAKVPRLRDLTEVALRNFVLDEESLGATCTKYR